MFDEALAQIQDVRWHGADILIGSDSAGATSSTDVLAFLGLALGRDGDSNQVRR